MLVITGVLFSGCLIFLGSQTSLSVALLAAFNGLKHAGNAAALSWQCVYRWVWVCMSAKLCVETGLCVCIECRCVSAGIGVCLGRRVCRVGGVCVKCVCALLAH